MDFAFQIWVGKFLNDENSQEQLKIGGEEIS